MSRLNAGGKLSKRAYLMVSLQFVGLDSVGSHSDNQTQSDLLNKFNQHPYWSEATGWKHRLNNLQLIIQPYIYFCLIRPWLQVFKIPQLSVGFTRLIAIMDEFKGWVPMIGQQAKFFFSSA